MSKPVKARKPHLPIIHNYQLLFRPVHRWWSNMWFYHPVTCPIRLWRHPIILLLWLDIYAYCANDLVAVTVLSVQQFLQFFTVIVVNCSIMGFRSSSFIVVKSVESWWHFRLCLPTAPHTNRREREMHYLINKMGNPSNGPATKKWYIAYCSLIFFPDWTYEAFHSSKWFELHYLCDRWRHLVVSLLLKVPNFSYFLSTCQESTFSGLLRLKMVKIILLSPRWRHLVVSWLRIGTQNDQ